MRYKTTTAPAEPAGDGRYTFTVSDGDYDLEHDRIAVAGWDLSGFRANPTILANHDYRSFPIARASAVWATRDALKATIEFPPPGISARSDEARGLVRAGFLRTTSVGFDPGEHQPNARGGIDFTRGHRLLEVSLVGVPANPRAVMDEQKMRRWLRGDGRSRAAAAFAPGSYACDAEGRALDNRMIHLDLDELLGPVAIDLDDMRDAIAEAEHTRRQRDAIANYAHLEAVMHRTRRGR